VRPGQYARIFAPSLQFPNGRVAIYDQHPASTSCQVR
jgi:hypothetical protein